MFSTRVTREGISIGQNIGRSEPDRQQNRRRIVENHCLPTPWSVEERTCFIVRDHNGQALAYVYFEDESGRRSAAKLLKRDEARRIAVNIAKRVRTGSTGTPRHSRAGRPA